MPSPRMKTIVSYRTHRLTSVVGTRRRPVDYLERIDHRPRGVRREIKTIGADLIAELHEKYLDKSKTRSVWTVLVDP